MYSAASTLLTSPLLLVPGFMVTEAAAVADGEEGGTQDLERGGRYVYGVKEPQSHLVRGSNYSTP